MCQIVDTRAALLCLVSIRKAANLFIYIPEKAYRHYPVLGQFKNIEIE